MKHTLNLISIEEAVSYVHSNSRLFIQGAAMTPNVLIDELCNRHVELAHIEIIQMHTEGPATYTKDPYNKVFNVNSCFVGRNVRDAVNSDYGAYIPVFLSEIHLLFKRNILPLDVAFVQVSPPDKHGYCSLGTSVDVTLAAVYAAKIVIAQVNKYVPRTHGDGIIHIKRIDYAVQIDTPIYQMITGDLSDTDRAIGSHVAGLIEDEATLQMGIGNIPNAVLSNLGNHKHLGIHTEMFSDGILPLVEKGVITGEKKIVDQGKIVTSFAMGSQALYDFIDDNPIVNFKEASFTNNTRIIRKNPKVTAINSAIEIDLTGQICADTIGRYQYSGVGGQMDFIRGASISEGGKPIIAMPSMTKSGISKIVLNLKHGAGITTTRAHVHYVATEYGVVNLFGKNLKQRAKSLIEIAHPNFRETLEEQAFEQLKTLH